MKENIILKWSLILSIIIVANLFFNFSLSLIFDAPKQEEFCPFEKTSQVIENKKDCESSNGIWNPGKGSINEYAGYCDLSSKCYNSYEKAVKPYEGKVFIALVTIGVIILILSFFMKSNLVLGPAFALTAVLDFIVASIRYWMYSNELLKVIILFVALASLIYLAIKKFKNITE